MVVGVVVVVSKQQTTFRRIVGKTAGLINIIIVSKELSCVLFCSSFWRLKKERTRKKEYSKSSRDLIKNDGTKRDDDDDDEKKEEEEEEEEEEEFFLR